MPKVTQIPIPASLADQVANNVRTCVVLATARVETAMTQKVSTPGPPRSKPGSPPHIDTGQLRQSIHSSIDRQANRIVGSVAASVAHARLLEYGTAKMAARPFARRALLDEFKNITAIIGAPGLVK